MSMIAERMALLMDKKHISDSELADRIGVGPMTIKRYLMGYTEPLDEDLEAIAYVLEVSPDYLRGQKDFASFSEPMARIPVFHDFPENGDIEITELKPVEYICGSYGTQSVRNCFFIIAGDDLMSGAKITMGDKVLINPDKAVVSGDLAAVSVAGKKPAIRRVFFDGTKVLINTEGEHPTSEEYDLNKTKIELLGGVAFIISYPT